MNRLKALGEARRMTDDATVRLRSEALLLRVLRLEVVSGPDAGKRFESESES